MFRSREGWIKNRKAVFHFPAFWWRVVKHHTPAFYNFLHGTLRLLLLIWPCMRKISSCSLSPSPPLLTAQIKPAILSESSRLSDVLSLLHGWVSYWTQLCCSVFKVFLGDECWCEPRQLTWIASLLELCSQLCWIRQVLLQSMQALSFLLARDTHLLSYLCH